MNPQVFSRLRSAAQLAPLAALLLAAAPAPAQSPRDRVLDIQNLKIDIAPRFPNSVPTCQVLVIGGGTGGVAAAEDLARQGISVIMTEPTSHLGGQFTAQGVSTPDENRYIERDPGPGTQHYRELRDQVRAIYAAKPGISPSRAVNVGQCWVSRISGEPSVWEQAIDSRLAPLEGPHGIRAILLRHALISINRYPGNGQISYADFLDLDTGRRIRIGAQYVLDASETGKAIALSGCPWTIGQESQATYGEPDAPPEPHPDWIQSFTYSFDVRWTPPGSAPLPIIAKPADYDEFLSWGLYSLEYDYPPPRGMVTYKMLAKAPNTLGPFWTYRRLVAASSFKNNPQYADDIALINWRGNDYHAASFIGKPVDEQLRVLTQAKEFAQGFLYWLQTSCPRDDGSGLGYPEIQPAGDELGGDGFAPMPYLRESRRLLAQETLTENDLIAPQSDPDAKTGTDFPDSVGTALYSIDIHPALGEPPVLKAALPYEIPLGAFLTRSGPTNILPAAKDWGASRLALASARMHPTEWEAGEIAANLAAFCLKRDIPPSTVRADSALLSAFQSELTADGITLRWSDILAPTPEEKVGEPE